MTWLRQRWLPLLVLIVASTALIGSIAWTAGRGGGWPTGVPMMGPALRGNAPITSFADAQAAADRFGQRWGLHTGEVMRFDNGFYAELLDPAGNRATEVLIDPRTGAVGLEYGPAMMWNTVYGMHPERNRTGSAAIDTVEAQRIAQTWMDRHRPGEHAEDAELFPGYYTLHTTRDGKITGMLSVHSGTGAVWYHHWHGRFLDIYEPAVK
jgi:hypothetical protein